MTPSVSVIVPTFNRAPLLTQAIASILRQTRAPNEILVVDDGSTDNTSAVVHSFGANVRYLVQANRGPAAARNLALAHAQGDVVAFLDDDDIWLPQTLEWGIARLEDSSASSVEMVFGLTIRATGISWTGAEYTYAPLPPVWAIMSFCTLLCRRSVFTRIGLLDENLPYGEDVDWFLKTREQNVPFAFLSQVTHLYRMHESNLTNHRDKAHRYFLKALKLSLTRRSIDNPGTLPNLSEIPDADALRQNLKTPKA